MRVTMKRSIEPRREGELAMQKGSTWDVSDAQGRAMIANQDAEETPDTPLGTVRIEKSVSVGAATVSLTAYPVTDGVTPPDGAVAQLRVVEVTGTSLVGETPTCRDWKPYTSMWELRRPAKGGQPGLVRLISQCTGFAPSELVVEIPAIEEPAKEPTTTKSRRASADTASEG